MKILFLSDEESPVYWDYFRKETFEDIDLIVSCGDLKAEYLSFLTTMTSIPVLYIKGNHDKYEVNVPEGCISIEDDIYEFEGVRLLGLGGCQRYNRGDNQYTEKEMQKRIARLRWKLFRKKGFDILVTHAPAFGINDDTDLCHTGFKCFNRLIAKYKPKYFVNGHVHLTYGSQIKREVQVEDTKVINAYNHYIVEI